MGGGVKMPTKRKPRRTSVQLSYGIVRYAPNSHANPTGLCEDDPTHFDGWYMLEEDAKAVYNCWKRTHPSYIVCLVKMLDGRFL
jgi:hypothetical protein